jgi:hypothetical protein
MAEPTGRDRKIRFAEVRSALDEGISGADAARAHGLDGLLRLRTAKARQLAREQDRLERRLGPHHARVAELQARGRVNEELRGALAAERDRARARAPEVDRTTWMVHGHVREGDRGADDVIVALADAAGRRRARPNPVETTADGYFRLTLAVGAAAEGGKAERAEQKQPLFLQVYRGRRRLAVDERPFIPTGGVVDYRQIVLGADKSRAAWPPASERPSRRRDDEEPDEEMHSAPDA